VEHAVFAVEVCMRLVPESALHASLRDLVAGAPARMGLHQKWTLYRQASTLLVDHLSLLERGCWDFFDDDQRARRDYDMWTKGMTTEEGARPAPSGLPDPYRGDARYLTFTMAFLLVQGAPSARTLAAVCKVPEAELWKRDTFARILQGMGHLSFASVASDVVYLLPRDDGWGLTAQDLQHEKFAYLRQVI
jgi:hypothetical protein